MGALPQAVWRCVARRMARRGTRLATPFGPQLSPHVRFASAQRCVPKLMLSHLRCTSVSGMRSRFAAWLPLIGLAVACGGPAKPAASSEAPADGGDAESAPAVDPGAPAEKSEAPSSDAPPASAPASEQDVAAILQLVVDDPELDRYLHLEEPGRFPLQLAGERLPSGLKLTKATEPVKIVEAPKSKKDAVLVVTEIEVKGDRATVRYRYDIESIRGNVTLAKRAHGWELKNSRLVEH